MNNLTEQELKILYSNYVNYRDTKCNGACDLTVEEYFNKYGLKVKKENGETTYYGTYRLIKDIL